MASLNVVENLIDGQFVAPSSQKYIDVTSPVTGAVVGRCALSTAVDVDVAVKHAQAAFKEWSKSTIKTRAAIMLKFHSLMVLHAGEN